MPIAYAEVMAMAVILRPVNGMLADPSGSDYANVQAAVGAADRVTGAVEALGILDAHSDEIVVEARAVLAALPAAVDEAVMAALANAFERALPVVLAWVQNDSATIAVRVSEELADDSGALRVRLDFLAPSGENFL
jgi:hypothetical protein